MISVDIKKQLDNFTLDVEFEVEDEILGLLGASGSGKSMTLKCIAGIEKPDEGKIVLDGKTLFDSEKKINLRPQERKVGYLFQHYALFPNMTVFENIEAGIRGKEKDPKRVKKLLKELHLEKLANKKPNEISGGEKQRVALGRILINEPKILLLDEPFSALDDFLKWRIEIEVRDIIQKYNIPSIFVSHSREEVFRLCETISILNEGKSEPKKVTKDLFLMPETFASAILSGTKNFSEIRRLKDDEIFAENWGVKLKVRPPKSEELVGIHSNFVEIVDKPGENTFPLVVAREFEDINSMVLLVRPPKPVGDYGTIRVEIDKNKWKKMKGRENLYIRFPKEYLMLLYS